MGDSLAFTFARVHPGELRSDTGRPGARSASPPSAGNYSHGRRETDRSLFLRIRVIAWNAACETFWRVLK